MDKIGLGHIVGAPQAKQVDAESTLEGMSLIMANERSIAEMYRQYSAQTLDTTLQKQWQTFGDKAQVHVQMIKGVIAALRGDADYRSPAALEAERCAQVMLSLGIQGEQADLIRLSHLVAMGQVTIDYWRGVDSIASHTSDPSLVRVLRQAATTIQHDKRQHLSWNDGMLLRYMQKIMTGG